MGANIEQIVMGPTDASLDDRHRPEGLRLTTRVADALRSLPGDGTSIRARLVALARHLAARGEAGSSGVVDDLVSLCARCLTIARVSDAETWALDCLLPCCIHLAVVGRAATLSSAIDVVLAASARICDPRLRFRAHRLAFATRLGFGDLRDACVQAECAFRASLDVGTASCKFESLTLVVTLLEAMGLARDAKELAAKLMQWRSDDGPADVVRLANALHGLRACRQIDDVEAAEAFHARASDIFERAATRFSPLTVAAFESAKAAHLLWIGKPRAAARRLQRVLPAPALEADRRQHRALGLLQGAEADVRIAIGELAGIERSVDTLNVSLATCPVYSSNRYEIFRTLIKLQMRMPAKAGYSTAARLLEGYRDHPNPARPSVIPLDFLWWAESDEIPFDSPSLHASPLDERDSDVPLDGNPSFSEIGFDFDDFMARGADACRPESEATLRSAHYTIVEGWAIAAEIAMGGTGRQCVKVGRVAAALGAALGFSEHRCVAIDMGCRLRDIGRVAVADEARLLDRAFVMAERAKAGERMLSFSQDTVVLLAARIAKNCRAWWNGSGFPSALAADDIPIEARICAVADAIVELVDPLDRDRRWMIPEALKQIRCLSGVQFDPALVDLLSRVLRDERTDAIERTWRIRTTALDDPMAKAKMNLFETLELTV